jgi:chitin disaccharide deacetylase
VSRLIVNADDFGLTSGVNRAIMEMHRAGLVTSATLMARARATDEAIEMAHANPSLEVGCHVVLVDGEPVLPAAQLPTLANVRTNCFHRTLGSFVRRLLAGRIRHDEIEAEAAAQIARLQSAGLRLTHIDTHKHAHMFPAVLRPVLGAARAAGIRALRNPFEPTWSIRATLGAPVLRRAQVRLLRRLEPTFRRIVAEEGFATTDGALGVLATGSLDPATIDSLLRSLPDGTWELVTHPGYNDAELDRVRTRLRASREVEIDALRRLESFPAVERISFDDLKAGAT